MGPRYSPLFMLLLAIVIRAGADETAASTAKIPLAVDRFPVTGPTEGLEPQVLDFRYQPARWQTCIGLVDDPYKTIVGDDGGLYYEYGKQGPEAYNNGQGSFGTRILAGFVADADAGTLRQSLYSPRVPIVISEREVGSWRLRQETWSNRMRDTESAQPSADRVDYLAIAATNGGAESAAGQATLDIGTTTHLVLDDARERLLIDGRSDRIFCQFSQACEPLAQEPQIGADQKARDSHRRVCPCAAGLGTTERRLCRLFSTRVGRFWPAAWFSASPWLQVASCRSR